MKRSILTLALCLTGCATHEPVVPDALLAPEVVVCPPGYSSAAVGACLIALRSGLNRANVKLAEIGSIVRGPQ
jgi:hypothetical protein